MQILNWLAEIVTLLNGTNSMKSKLSQSRFLQRFCLSMFGCFCYLYVTYPRHDRHEHKCLQNYYKEYILVIHFNSPANYKNIKNLNDMYADIFGKVITCGPEGDAKSGRNKPDIELDNQAGTLGYNCAALAINKYPDYKGYFYGNDNMIINWWNLKHNVSRIWQATEPEWKQGAYSNILENAWEVWRMKMGITACQNYHEALNRFASASRKSFDGKAALETYLSNGEGKAICGHGWSNFFYVPREFAESFSILSNIAYASQLHCDIAVPNIFRTLVNASSLLTLSITFLPNSKKDVVELFWDRYEISKEIVSPFTLKQLNEKDDKFNREKLKSVYFQHKNIYERCY